MSVAGCSSTGIKSFSRGIVWLQTFGLHVRKSRVLVRLVCVGLHDTKHDRHKKWRDGTNDMQKTGLMCESIYVCVCEVGGGGGGQVRPGPTRHWLPNVGGEDYAFSHCDHDEKSHSTSHRPESLDDVPQWPRAWTPTNHTLRSRSTSLASLIRL